MAGKKKTGIWNWIDKIEGDKVIWMIVFLLIMISILAISSSTSLLALSTRTTRIEIIQQQTGIVILGLGIIFLCYNIKKLGFFIWCSKWGFVISMILLLILDFHIKLPPVIKAQEINHAWRTLLIFGIQVHVFEIVKVAMVMYLSWAVYAYNKDQNPDRKDKEKDWLAMANWLGSKKSFEFMKKPFCKRVMYFYIPIFLVCILVQPGSNSSLMIIGSIMIATLLVGGIETKRILVLTAGFMLLIFSTYSIYKMSGGTVFSRIGTGISRIMSKPDIDNVKKQQFGSAEFYQELDKIKQPYGAKVAIHEGGLLGKGPGGSTQKYTVSLIFGDYMYCFLLEEYGLVGGLLVIVLYVSLLARGSIIARMCGDNDFSKAAVGGLTLLITAQAFLHMFINVGIGPLTGQTLPMISHGSSSFIMFSLAFGIILSISRNAKKQMEKEIAAATPIYARPEDDIHSSMTELDQLESMEENEI